MGSSSHSYANINGAHVNFLHSNLIKNCYLYKVLCTNNNWITNRISDIKNLELHGMYNLYLPIEGSGSIFITNETTTLLVTLCINDITNFTEVSIFRENRIDEILNG